MSQNLIKIAVKNKKMLVLLCAVFLSFSCLAQSYHHSRGYFVKEGEKWTEYNDKSTNIWATYTQYSTDDSYYYIKNSSSKVCVPKKNGGKFFIYRNDNWTTIYSICSDITSKSAKHNHCNVCSGNGSSNCSVCGGSGKTICTMCMGTGRTMQTIVDYYTYSANIIYVVCPSCSGSGKQNCTWCYGKGSKECVFCNGKCYTISYPNNGGGYIPPVSGYSGSEDGYSGSSHNSSGRTCAGCHGTGRCSYCKGLGITSYGETHDCLVCGGSGNCKVCHGQGIIR